MKVNTLRSHCVMHILLCCAAATGMFASAPLHARDITEEIARGKKLTPEQKKDLTAAFSILEEADEHSKTGRHAEVVAMYREGLKGYESVLGTDDWETLTVRTNLAIILNKAQKRDEAVVEFRAILAIKQRAFGLKNNGTWNTWNDLARTLETLGKHDEAVAEYRAVLPWMLRGYGPENENTLETQMRLANVLQAQGKNAEAEQLHRAVIKVKERVMGPKHPSLYQSCYHLALCLESQGKLMEALEFMLRAEHGWERLSYRENTDFKDAKAARARIEAALKK